MTLRINAKVCPGCGKTFSDEYIYCYLDGKKLIDNNSTKTDVAPTRMRTSIGGVTTGDSWKYDNPDLVYPESVDTLNDDLNKIRLKR